MNSLKPEKAIVLGAVWQKSSNYFKQQTCKKVTVFSVLSGRFKVKFHTGATYFFFLCRRPGQMSFCFILNQSMRSQDNFEKEKIA